MWPVNLLFIGALAVATASQTPSEALPDPTRPYQYSQAMDISSLPASPEAQEWHLAGIQVRNGVKRAILNGKLVKEGEKAGSATVTAIGTSDVTLSVEQRLIVVRLLIPQIKQAIAAVRKDEQAKGK